MKAPFQTPARLLQSRPFIVKPTHFRLAKWSSTTVLASSDTSSSSPDHQSSLDLLKSSLSGKKFNDLVHDLNQRSALLVRLENINPPPAIVSDLTSPTTSETPDDPKTRRRTYEEDPEFKFERKRGKRHVMIALKQAGSGGANQNQNLDLVAELDISLRRPGLEKVIISLPMQWKPSSSVASTATPPEVSATKLQETSVTAPQAAMTDIPQAETTESQNIVREVIPVDRSGIDEFIQLYLGPLVWSNPNVDILLTYDSQSGPTLSFHTNNGIFPPTRVCQSHDPYANVAFVLNYAHLGEKVEEKDLGGLTRSEILHLIVHQGAS